MVSSLQNKDEMEAEMRQPTADGGWKTEAQVVQDVLSKRTISPRFLRNVGVVHQPTQSRKKKIPVELAEQETETRPCTELQDLVKKLLDQINQLTAKVKETEENHDVLMKGAAEKHVLVMGQIERLLQTIYQER